MVDLKGIEFEVFYDYLCPFVYRMWQLIDSVQAGGRSLRVGWRYFSLTQVNSKDAGWTVWNAPAGETVRGRLAFQAAEAARRQGRFGELHPRLLRARHAHRLDLDQPEVVEGLAAAAGLDLDRFHADLADPTILDALARDHTDGAGRLGVFGTPTLHFSDGTTAYVRLAGSVQPAEAPHVFDRLVAIAKDEPAILEIKRPRRPAE